MGGEIVGDRPWIKSERLVEQVKSVEKVTILENRSGGKNDQY